MGGASTRIAGRSPPGPCVRRGGGGRDFLIRGQLSGQAARLPARGWGSSAMHRHNLILFRQLENHGAQLLVDFLAGRAK